MSATTPGDRRDDPRARSEDRFPIDYQARFPDAFRAEIAHFVEACAAAQTGSNIDSVVTPERSNALAAATLNDDRLAVEIGVAARQAPWKSDELAVERTGHGEDLVTAARREMR